MTARGPQPSTGERIVFCTRVNCIFAGDLATYPGCKPGFAWYECEAEIVVLDRRAKSAKTCGRFVKKP